MEAGCLHDVAGSSYTCVLIVLLYNLATTTRKLAFMYMHALGDLRFAF